MTTYMRCDRCGYLNPGDPWLRLKVCQSDEAKIAPDSDQIDLCYACEADMVKWMAKPLVDSITRVRPDPEGDAGMEGVQERYRR